MRTSASVASNSPRRAAWSPSRTPLRTKTVDPGRVERWIRYVTGGSVRGYGATKGPTLSSELHWAQARCSRAFRDASRKNGGLGRFEAALVDLQRLDLRLQRRGRDAQAPRGAEGPRHPAFGLHQRLLDGVPL